MTQRLTPTLEAEIRSELGEVPGYIADYLRPLLREIDALRAELAGAEERGAARERAAVVAWMPLQMERFDDEAGYAIETLAADIADGGHVRTGTTAADGGESQP